MAGLEQAFELAVVISAVDRFTAPARAMASQMGLLSKQSDALQKKMQSFKAMAITGGVITGIGGVMAAGLIKATESAGHLQTAMMGVKEAAKLNNTEFQKAMNLSQTVGIPTIFSAEQVGGIMAAMSNAGLTKQQILDPSILRQYVNFADVQAQIKHENAPDVVSSAVGMAHQYQIYSTAQITPFLNNLNAALLHTNDTASEFATTYKYISNQARTMGMSSTDTLTATAWLDRMGFGSGRGGTNFADFLLRSIYGSSGKKADSAMQKAGFVVNGHSVFTNSSGKFVGVPEAVKILQQFGDRFNHNSNQMTPLLHAIFGTQGARVAMMMTSSGASEQYTNIQKQIAGTASINKAQQDLNNTWQGKVKQLQTTLQDIQQAFGKSTMAGLLPLVTGLDNILGKVLLFEQQHPKIMKWIATFAGIAAAVMLVVGPVMLLTGALGYLFTSQSIRAGAGILGKSIGGMLGPVSLLIAAGYLLYEAWTNNWGGIQQKTASVIDWIKSEFPKIDADVKRMLTDLGFTSGGKFQVPEWAKVLGGVAIGSKALGMLGGGAAKALKPLGAVSQFFRYQRALGGGIGGSLAETGKFFGKRGIAGVGRIVESGARAIFGDIPVSVVKQVGKWTGKFGGHVGRGMGALMRHPHVRTFGKGLMHAYTAPFTMAGKGLGMAGKFLGKAALDDMKWLATNVPRIGKAFGSLAMSVGKSTISLAANAAKTVAIKTAQLAVMAATKVWTAIQLAFNAVMDANPIALIILAIAALITIIVLMVTHWKTVINVVKQVWTWMKNFASDIGSVFSNLWKEAVNWGTNIVQGLWNGIKSMWGWLKSNITGWIKDVIPGPIRKALGINSPSRLMAQYGLYTAQGLAQGMMNNSHLVQHAAKQLSIAATPGGMQANGVNNGINSIFHQVGATQNTTVHIHSGAVQINGAGENSTDIVDEMFRRLGPSTRTKNMSRPFGPNRMVFGG